MVRDLKTQRLEMVRDQNVTIKNGHDSKWSQLKIDRDSKWSETQNLTRND